MLAGPIERLAVYDAQYNSELVHTLRCWLACLGDVPTPPRSPTSIPPPSATA